MSSSDIMRSETWWVNLLPMAYAHLTREPVVRESRGREHGDGRGLVCDRAVRGVWQPQTEALFDFRVCNSDAQSYINRHVTAVLDSLARAKKNKHQEACWERRADFTPFVVTTDGFLQRKGEHFVKRLAARLADKWTKPSTKWYSTTMNFVMMQLSLSILRATNHCLRGARRKLSALPLKTELHCHFSADFRLSTLQSPPPPPPA